MPGKYRYELKYTLNPADAALIKKQLALVCKKDSHSISDDVSYYIRSLYFDDPAHTAYFDKINGEFRRKKYRIRIYNGSDNVIKLECKHKDGNFTYKEDQTIDRKTCDLIVNKQYDKVQAEGGLLQKFLLDAKLFGLTPTVIVDYRRLAFTYPVSEVRITFDENIRSGRYNYELFSKDVNTMYAMDPGPVELEVKYNENLPDHIAAIINSVPKQKQAISKFALSYQIKN